MRAPFGFRKASRLHAPSFSRLFVFSRFFSPSEFFSFVSRWLVALPGLTLVVP